MQRTGAHPARHPSGFSSARSPRHRGPAWAASCRRSSRSPFLLLRQVSIEANDHVDAVQGCTDSWINRRRSRRWASQAGRENARRVAAMDRRDCEAVHGRTVWATPPRREAQGSPIRTMRIGPTRPVP